MADFVFDKEIFRKKFFQGDIIRNRAKSTVDGCDDICPSDSNNASIFKGYKSNELLADTIHYLLGEVLNEKGLVDIEDRLKIEIQNQMYFQEPELSEVFQDIISSFYFEKNNKSDGGSLSLLRYQPESRMKELGKFVFDVFFDENTKKEFSTVFAGNLNPLEDIVSNAYTNLKLLKTLKRDKKYSRIFANEFDILFKTMNSDFRAALDGQIDVKPELEFLVTYYMFVYLSQIALRMDGDLNRKEISNNVIYFKAEKEAVSEDRECVIQGWKKVERKTAKIFRHLVVLNMLNCHDNTTPYYTYSDLYELYKNNTNQRKDMDEAIDYLINQYTVEYHHDTDIPGIDVDFNVFEYPDDELQPELKFQKKIQYLYECVSHQLDSKNNRKNVVSYVAGNYNHILKMRFVKSWGQMGSMVMISNEDLILIIQICQKSSHSLDKKLGIQISDLFKEFEKRCLYMDGKTKQYIIDYLIEINLIDSKCDSEEARYVKRIQ